MPPGCCGSHGRRHRAVRRRGNRRDPRAATRRPRAQRHPSPGGSRHRPGPRCPSADRGRGRPAVPIQPAPVSPFVSPSPLKRRCRARAARNHNPRVGGSSPSSGTYESPVCLRAFAVVVCPGAGSTFATFRCWITQPRSPGPSLRPTRRAVRRSGLEALWDLLRTRAPHRGSHARHPAAPAPRSRHRVSRARRRR